MTGLALKVAAEVTARQVERKYGYQRPARAVESPFKAHEWAAHYFPNAFSRPFTEYQKEFWEWGWSIPKDGYVRPGGECEPRGVGKSTNAEAWVVSLVARKLRGMI